VNEIKMKFDMFRRTKTKLNTLEDLNKVNLNDFNSVVIFYYSDVICIYFTGTHSKDIVFCHSDTSLNGFILRCRLQNINVSELLIATRLFRNQ